MVERGVLDHADQIFMLMADELDAFRFNPERFTDIVRQREHDYLELFELEPPFIVDTVVPPLGAWKRRADRSLAPVARHGAHRHGRQRRHGDRPGPGADRPVRPTALEPATCSWPTAPTRRGRRCSCPPAPWSRASARWQPHDDREPRARHPCVVSVEDATLRIPDGAMVTVDGSAGTVTVH